MRKNPSASLAGSDLGAPGQPVKYPYHLRLPWPPAVVAFWNAEHGEYLPHGDRRRTYRDYEKHTTSLGRIVKEVSRTVSAPIVIENVRGESGPLEEMNRRIVTLNGLDIEAYTPRKFQSSVQPLPEMIPIKPIDKLTHFWANISSYSEWVVSDPDWPEHLIYKIVRDIPGCSVIEPQLVPILIDGKLFLHLESRNRAFDTESFVRSEIDTEHRANLRDIKDASALGGDLSGWVHSQRRDWTYAEMMGKERGPYKIEPHYSEYNRNDESDGSDDMGAAPPISAHKTHRHYGGDERTNTSILLQGAFQSPTTRILVGIAWMQT